MKTIKWFIGKKEYLIFLGAVVVIILNWIGGWFWEINVVDPAKFAKIAYAIIAVSIGAGCTWIWMNFIPKLKRMIDPDTFETEKDSISTVDRLTKWQKTKLAFWFFALFMGCYTALAIF